ncbi:MAG: alpha-N-arabinofuranosidase, partial [Clostridia bacterium]|nr:alpha-N-arabinofuranosidase [Clostridia bacterium]
GLSPMSEERRRNGQEKPWKLKYFGIGNETWGCGGNMLPEYYADEFRRYNTYCRDYAGVDHIFRVASGANADDYNWTDVLLKKAARFMDGVSLHYYTVPTGDWGHKGSALDFDREMYVDTIRAAYKMEELVTRHSAVMDRYDPKKRIALVVDEWGTWFDVEEGTNPGFLYQQNSLRDAIVAGVTLNIFNKHADRVRMATVAQTINVLQALALTDGEKMLKTPTFFVFKLYKDHMDNTLLGSYLTTPFLRDGEKTPTLTESASLCPDGTVIATVVNASPDEAQEITCQVADTAVTSVEAEILAGEMHAHNTFDNNTAVSTEAFTGFTATADGFTATLPPCSVVRFRIR